MKRRPNWCQFIRGRFRLLSVDANDRVRSDTGWLPNLILNQGMNGVTTRYWADSFTHCVLGDGILPTVLSGGDTQASQTNVTVTLSGGSFTFTSTAVDGGKIIKFSGGQRATIVAVQNSTTATVNVSQSVGATTFEVFQTTQTGLVSEVKRSNIYHTALGGCSTVLSAPNTLTLRRSFNFPMEVGLPGIYNEIGLSWTATVGANLFSRIALPAPVEVSPGLRPRVVYELTMTLAPTSPTFKEAIMTGWPVAPAPNTHAYEAVEDWGLAIVSSLGLTVPQRIVSGVPILAGEPSALAEVLVGTDTQALAAPGDPVLNRWQAGSYAGLLVNEPYINGTYTRFRTVIIPTNEAASAAIRVFSVGHTITPSVDFLPVYTLRFEHNQIKTGAVFLGMRFALVWNRIL